MPRAKHSALWLHTATARYQCLHFARAAQCAPDSIQLAPGRGQARDANSCSDCSCRVTVECMCSQTHSPAASNCAPIKTRRSRLHCRSAAAEPGRVAVDGLGSGELALSAVASRRMWQHNPRSGTGRFGERLSRKPVFRRGPQWAWKSALDRQAAMPQLQCCWRTPRTSAPNLRPASSGTVHRNCIGLCRAACTLDAEHCAQAPSAVTSAGLENSGFLWVVFTAAEHSEIPALLRGPQRQLVLQHRPERQHIRHSAARRCRRPNGAPLGVGLIHL